MTSSKYATRLVLLTTYGMSIRLTKGDSGIAVSDVDRSRYYRILWRVPDAIC